jgi:SRSO17 transposase
VQAEVAQVQGWAAELEALCERMAPRFGRVEVRRRAGAVLRGLLAGVERKNSWQLAEQAGAATPDGTQRLLNHARWDAGEVRDELRGYVVEHLGDPGAVLVVDETGFLKKGTKSAGVQRQYSGTAGRIENCQVGVFLAYAGRRGHALLDRELYLPDGWLGDRVRCREAAIPDEIGFRTKPELARVMLERALEAEIPVAWVTADEVYGGDGRLRRWLEEREVPHVLAVKRSEALRSMRMRQERAWRLAAQVPAGAWRQLSAGDGAKGPRVYAWARVAIRPLREPGWEHWLLVRRSLRDGELAFYVCYAPARTTLGTLVRVAGTRWMVEMCQPQCTHIRGLAA